MDNVEFNGHHERAVHEGAARAYAVGRGLVDLDDLRQEAWLWIYENLDKVQPWLEGPRYDRLRTAAFEAGVILVREQMRYNSGAAPQDFAVYTAKEVGNLLPAVWVDGIAQPGEEVHEGSRKKREPSEGGVMMAMLADVKRAYDRLPDTQRNLLEALHGPTPKTHKQVADEEEATEATIYRREQKALEALVDLLGGPRITIKRRRSK